MLFHFAKQFVQCGDFAFAQARECIDDPAFMHLRHFSEHLAPRFSQANAQRTPIIGDSAALHQTFGFELVSDASHVAAGHHHASRQLIHLEALGRALQLRHQIKARQRSFELLTQTAAHPLLNQLRAGQHAQPQPQCIVMILVGTGF